MTNLFVELNLNEKIVYHNQNKILVCSYRKMVMGRSLCKYLHQEWKDHRRNTSYYCAHLRLTEINYHRLSAAPVTVKQNVYKLVINFALVIRFLFNVLNFIL